MSPEQKRVVELTPDQLETADYFLDVCDLQDFADVDLEMMGQSGSVRYGLGRCAEHLMDRTPEEIREMVIAKLAIQKRAT